MRSHSTLARSAGEKALCRLMHVVRKLSSPPSALLMSWLLSVCRLQDTDVVGSCAPFERVVVLDGSWRKAHAMLQHPSLRGLRRVQLPTNVRTVFWRRGAGEFRGAVDEGVSTIEAIHW